MMWPFSETVEDEAVSFAALGALKKLGCYPSSFDSEDSLQQCIEKIEITRAWVQTLERGQVKAAYLKWLDYSEKEVARYRKDKEMWNRRDELLKSIPMPPQHS